MTIDAQQAFGARMTERRRAPYLTVPHVIAGQKYFEGQLMKREDPSNPSLVVSACHDAPVDLVERAVRASRHAQREWSRVPHAERIERVRRAIPFIEERLEDWAVRVALEIGKPYIGARAEGAEVLEIVRQYTEYASAPGAFEDERTDDPTGLSNDSVLRPYGVFGVITPFNYPIVQAAGPAVAALIAGNGVVVKTSHDGPWSGQAVYELCEAMELPRGLVNVVHGGDVPGRALVASEIDGVCFTGSVAVGRSILRDFASGPYPRPVIAEMGGKNPAFVTASADLPLAATGVARSAFGLSGQKCSAASKAYVHRSVYDDFLSALVETTDRFVIGDPRRKDVFMGPVINDAALDRFTKAASAAGNDGSILRGGRRIEGGIFEGGPYVEPTIATGLPADHRINRDELFLPFVSVLPFDTLDAAIADANRSAFGLTAGVYAQDEQELDLFLSTIEAGVLYANRAAGATTGAWPGFQSFCGWKGSGTTGKGGLGSWYVPQFMREQSHTVFGTP